MRKTEIIIFCYHIISLKVLPTMYRTYFIVSNRILVSLLYVYTLFLFVPLEHGVKASIPRPFSSLSTTSIIPSKVAHKDITETKIKDLLQRIHRWQKIHSKFENNFPFVTVTYAQSLDGMIAIRKTDNDDSKVDDKSTINSHSNKGVSSNLQLSCEESFKLTHALRSIHDGILIGGNTLLNDNPRLNNRLWISTTNENCNDEHLIQHEPVPIILDTHLNHVMKMIHSNTKIKSASTHEKIIICCSEDAYKSYNEEIQSNYKCKCIHLVPCKLNEQRMELGDNGKDLELKGGGLNLHSILHNLCSEHGIKSIMVEGGASILSSFMLDAKLFVNCVCITIVPKMIGGKNGVLSLQACNLIKERHSSDYDEKVVIEALEFDPMYTAWTTIGSDCIFLGVCGVSEGDINQGD